jgi:exonuclease VII small subunit
LDKFVLEVLGNVIGKDRKKGGQKEQAKTYERMSKGLEEIVKEVEKQHGEVNTRKKELEKREGMVRKAVERGEKLLR